MKVLVFRNYDKSLNNHYAELHLLIGLQKKGVTVTCIGGGQEKNLTFLSDNGVRVINTFDAPYTRKNFKQELKTFIINEQFNIVHLFISKQIRIILPIVKKLPIKVVTYYGSVSLHWHDPSAYLTFLNKRINAIICNSDFVYKHVKKQLLFKNKSKAHKIYKGYDPEWFKNIEPYNYKTNLGISKKHTIAIIVARNSKVKGIKYFIEAAHLLELNKDIHFVIVGGKTETFKEVISTFKNCKNIHLLGERSDAVSLIKGADIYVQTSLSEGFGRAISEAMCVEKPIIMTDAGGCTELIDEQSGIITPVKDSKSIATAINKLANNPDLQLKMGVNAQKRITNVYHVNTTIEKTFSLYKKLLNE